MLRNYKNVVNKVFENFKQRVKIFLIPSAYVSIFNFNRLLLAFYNSLRINKEIPPKMVKAMKVYVTEYSFQLVGSF